jgi:hypothetical protein
MPWLFSKHVVCFFVKVKWVFACGMEIKWMA